MSSIFFYIALLCIAAIIGFVVALPVLLPPLRRRGKRGGRARQTEMLVCGVLAFALTFSIWNLGKVIAAEIWLGSSGGSASDLTDREIWLRESIPPFTQKVCYTQDVRGCQIADKYEGHFTPDTAWSNYLFTMIFSAGAGLCGALWVRHFTRPAPVHNP